MKKALRASFLFSAIALTAAGCNGILGNEPGSLDPDAGDALALGPDTREEIDVVITSDAAPEEAAPIDALDPVDSGPEGCELGKKSCSDLCVSKTDPVFGCNDVSCTPCSLRHAVAVCSGAGCAIGACDTGYADCDQIPANGCETDLSQTSHCGSCNAVCGATAPYCAPSGTTFTCSTGCTGSSTLCGSQCADLSNSPNHCGSCTNACTAVANGQVRCEVGVCKFSCNAGLHACGAECVSNSSVATCGASCTPCTPPPNATATCNGTACGFKCSPGFHKCGEVCVSNSDVATCGASCTACTPPANSTPTCDGKTCGFSCNAGLHLCGGACVSNTDVATCGGACAPCPGGPNGTATCDGVTCGFTCTNGFADCDKKPGCEVTSASDSANCGVCGHKCLDTERCEVGVCVSE